MNRLPSIALGLLVAAGCARSGDDGEAAPIAPRALTGTAQVVGTDVESWVQFRSEAETVRVVGDLAPEVAALQGYRIRIVGTSADDPGPVPAFRVTDYDLVEVHGRTPVVGTLLRVGSDFWIAEPDSVGGERLQLIGVAASIGEATGGKIWVVGTRGSSEIRVQSYGVIRRTPAP